MTTTAYTLLFREFGSASLFAMLVVSTLFFGFYLARAWLEIGPAARFRLRCKLFYSDVNKAAIGWFVSSFGAMLKNGAALWVLHVQAQGYHHVTAAVPVLYMVGTGLALWGMVCLMHALTRGSWRRGQWTAMIGGALAFGAIWTFL